MKLYGILLLAGYFLAREQEMGLGKKTPTLLLKNTLIYGACVSAALIAGMACLWHCFPDAELVWRPMGMLLAAALVSILFKRSTHFMLAGALTAFWVMNWASEATQFIGAVICACGAVLILQFFYLGARERTLRLDMPPALRKGPARLVLLFALAVLFAFIYEKAVQVL